MLKSSVYTAFSSKSTTGAVCHSLSQVGYTGH